MASLTALRERKILDQIFLHLVADEEGLAITSNAEDPLAPRSIFVSQPSDALRNVLNFAVVVNNRRFLKGYLDFAIKNEYRKQNTQKNRNHNKLLTEWYQDYNTENRPLTGLPEEILDKILDHLTIKRGHLLPFKNRASLSVDSFSSTAASLPEDSNQIRQFRLICHRFARLGLRRLFVRVRIRFSSEGFSTLRAIAQRQDFSGLVKQFSYMIPRFYPSDGTTLEDKLEEAREIVIDNKRKLALRAQGRVAPVDRQQPTAQELRFALRRGEADEEQLKIALEKAKQQREIIEQEIDVKALVYALTNFKNLQQIRLMKVVDANDKWDKYLAAHADVATEFRPFEWSYAYEHAATTLAFAIQQSHSGVDRFSSRFMEPRTPILVTQSLRRRISSIVERATVLEFEFRQTDVAVSLEQKMSQLSGLFQVGFKAAVELRLLHIGFTRPVSIPLADIFHNVQFKKLEHIGLHNWQMRGDELLDLLKRHKKTLKSLRLRHILLRRGQPNDCSWRHVLQFIRRGIRPEPLHGYVSLRGIDYVDDDIHAANGMHFLNGPAQNVTISDEDSDSDLDDMSDAWSDSTEDVIEEDEASEASASSTVVGEQNEDEQDELDETDESHESLESHDEVDDLARDFQNISIVETMLLPCNCANGTRWNDLDDDGRAVTKYQWQRWQKWVVKHCSLHDPAIPEDS